MNHTISATRLTLLFSRVVAVIVLALIPFLPSFLRFYAVLRNLNHNQCLAVMIGYCCCVPVIELALWHLDKLLRNILAEEVFTQDNVRRVRIIRWCCFAISLLCLPVACVYCPLLFVVVIMGFLSLVVTVVVRVMDAAVTIREENDLTI